MQIGEVIRKHRKELNMTQEEMAKRLGVTAPAVNKWENGNSVPDVMLLAPIARLLGISLDMLLSFEEELTDEEINNFVEEVNERLKNESFKSVFEFAKHKIQQYPSCEKLILWVAIVLEARLLIEDDNNCSCDSDSDAHDNSKVIIDKTESEDYGNYIKDCYIRVLDSKEESLWIQAANALFHLYMRDKEYEKAEECLKYLSEQNPEKKCKQAVIYSKTGRVNDAYRMFEELVFTGYNSINMAMNNIYMLAMEQGDSQKAHYIVDKMKEFDHAFEMGAYHESSAGLDLAIAEKDVEATITAMEGILTGINDISAFTKSKLYEHMDFKNVDEDFMEQLRKDLLENLYDEETFGFLMGNDKWEEIKKRTGR